MSEEWRDDPRFGGTKSKTIHLFGVDYKQKGYVNEFRNQLQFNLGYYGKLFILLDSENK